MGSLATFGAQLGKDIIDEGKSMGMGMLREAIMGNRDRKKQLEQQQKLQEMQIAGNKDLMDYGFKQQLDMWEATNYEAQMKQLEKAGLNPAMIYGGSGPGGGTLGAGVAGTVGGSEASNESQMMGARAQQEGMALQRSMMSAQVDKLKAEAESLRADAGLKTEKGKTEEESREYLLENMKQEGVMKWFENLRNDIKQSGVLEDREVRLFNNERLNVSTAFQKVSTWNQEVTTAIAKTLAETGKAEAGALLDNEKAKGYWQELVNATKKADADMMKAAASKLAIEWETGEYTNWMTWVKLAVEGVNTVSGAVGNVGKGVGSIIKATAK